MQQFVTLVSDTATNKLGQLHPNCNRRRNEFWDEKAYDLLLQRRKVQKDLLRHHSLQEHTDLQLLFEQKTNTLSNYIQLKKQDNFDHWSH